MYSSWRWSRWRSPTAPSRVGGRVANEFTDRAGLRVAPCHSGLGTAASCRARAAPGSEDGSARRPARDGGRVQRGRRSRHAGGRARQHRPEEGRRRPGRGSAGAVQGVLRRRVLRTLLPPASARGCARHRLGRPGGSEGIHLDEQPRDRERSGDHRASLGSAEVHREARGSRPEERHRRAQGRRAAPAAGRRAGRLRSSARRPVGDRDRQPVRARPHRDGGDHLGHCASA